MKRLAKESKVLTDKESGTIYCAVLVKKTLHFALLKQILSFLQKEMKFSSKFECWGRRK